MSINNAFFCGNTRLDFYLTVVSDNDRVHFNIRGTLYLADLLEFPDHLISCSVRFQN